MSDNQVFLLVIGIPFYLVGCLAVYAFLKEDWEVYEGIVEGQLEPWLEFQRNLGHRP